MDWTPVLEPGLHWTPSKLNSSTLNSGIYRLCRIFINWKILCPFLHPTAETHQMEKNGRGLLCPILFFCISWRSFPLPHKKLSLWHKLKVSNPYNIATESKELRIRQFKVVTKTHFLCATALTERIELREDILKSSFSMEENKSLCSLQLSLLDSFTHVETLFYF